MADDWSAQDCTHCGEDGSNCKDVDGKFWHYKCYREVFPLKESEQL